MNLPSGALPVCLVLINWLSLLLLLCIASIQRAAGRCSLGRTDLPARDECCRVRMGRVFPSEAHVPVPLQ